MHRRKLGKRQLDNRRSAWSWTLIAIACMTSFWPAPAAACECGKFDPQWSFEEAGLVFLGTSGPEISPFGDQAAGMRIDVERVFKGRVPATVHLAYGSYDLSSGTYTESSCDYLPPPNQRGVFFANRQGKYLSTDWCWNSIELGDDQEFEVFGAGATPDPSLPIRTAPPPVTPATPETWSGDSLLRDYPYPGMDQETYPGAIDFEQYPSSRTGFGVPYLGFYSCPFIAAIIVVIVLGAQKLKTSRFTPPDHRDQAQQ